MTNPMREVMAEVFEFILSLFILGGSGFLLYHGIAAELASGMISMVSVYWFTQRSNQSAVNNLLRQSPTLVPITNDIHTTLPQTQVPMPATGVRLDTPIIQPVPAVQGIQAGVNGE